GRHDDLDAAHVRENALRTLRVGLPAADTAAARGADGHGCGELTRRAVAQPGELAHDLIEARIDVIGKLDFRDRLEAVDPHADGRGDDAAFRNRGVEYAMLAVLPLQSLGDTEHAAEDAHVFAQTDHARIALQHHVHGRVKRLDHVHARHDHPFFATDGAACWR